MTSPRYLAISGALLLALTSCSNSADTDQPAATGDAPLQVVTSTDVYADLVSQIGGDHVEVDPLIASTSIDPHSYEATPQDRLAVDNADLVVANGGGYDPFMDTLVEASGAQDQFFQVLSDVDSAAALLANDEAENTSDDDASATEENHSHEHDGDHPHDHDEGHDHSHAEHDHDHGHSHGGVNPGAEHVWYGLEQMSDFALTYADELAEADPENADEYQTNAAELAADIDDLLERASALDADDVDVLATESVSGLLLDAAHFNDVTDPQFLFTVEHGDEASVQQYNQALNTAESVGVLAFNPQTETSQAQRIRQTAEASGAVVVEFTETLPGADTSYQEWMSQNIDTLDEAIQASEN